MGFAETKNDWAAEFARGHYLNYSLWFHLSRPVDEIVVTPECILKQWQFVPEDIDDFSKLPEQCKTKQFIHEICDEVEHTTLKMTRLMLELALLSLRMKNRVERLTFNIAGVKFGLCTEAILLSRQFPFNHGERIKRQCYLNHLCQALALAVLEEDFEVYTSMALGEIMNWPACPGCVVKNCGTNHIFDIIAAGVTESDACHCTINGQGPIKVLQNWVKNINYMLKPTKKRKNKFGWTSVEDTQKMLALMYEISIYHTLFVSIDV